jgi:hypothetical protein
MSLRVLSSPDYEKVVSGVPHFCTYVRVAR